MLFLFDLDIWFQSTPALHTVNIANLVLVSQRLMKTKEALEFQQGKTSLFPSLYLSVMEADSFASRNNRLSGTRGGKSDVEVVDAWVKGELLAPQRRRLYRYAQKRHNQLPTTPSWKSPPIGIPAYAFEMEGRSRQMGWCLAFLIHKTINDYIEVPEPTTSQ